MKAMNEFLKSTIVGGLLVVVPVYFSVLLLAKALAGLVKLLAPVTAMRGIFRSFERWVLEKVPGLGILRGAMRRISGESEDEMFQPVLVEIEDALTPAFIVEELDDGRCGVLVPSVPTPAAEALYILTRDRIHWVDAPVTTEAVAVITRWGAGTGKLVKAMR